VNNGVHTVLFLYALRRDVVSDVPVLAYMMELRRTK
jgi:hypothetical protein